MSSGNLGGNSGITGAVQERRQCIPTDEYEKQNEYPHRGAKGSIPVQVMCDVLDVILGRVLPSTASIILSLRAFVETALLP
jgi:hypothetical protein